MADGRGRPDPAVEATSPIGASPSEDPIDLIVVATWFPGHADVAAGRFVADQATFVAATGAARPHIITFRRAALTGGGRTRSRQEAAVEAASDGAVETEAAFHAPAWGVGELPVARLTIPDGRAPAAGIAHEVAHRSAALRRFADRILAADGGHDAGPPSRGIVHAHTGYPDGAAAVTLADRLGWPLVISEHASFLDRILANPATRDAYVAACRRAARIVAVGEELAARIRTAVPAAAGRVVVIPNGVDTAWFRPGPGDDRREDELLWVGRLSEAKGTQTLLEAFARVAADRPTARLRLVGRAATPELDRRWRTEADRLGVTDRVSFEDAADRSAIVAAMRRASVFVHPSRFETFGIVAAEALACGTPVVATDSGGVTGILGPEPAALGAVVPVDDAPALATAILDALDRRATFDAEAMHAGIAARFGAATVAARWVELYRDVLREASSSTLAAPAAPVLATRRLTPPPGRRIVVALDRESARRQLAGLPAEVRERLWLLTALEPASTEVPATGRIEAVDVDAAFRPPAGSTRMHRVLSDPRGAARRATGRDPGSPAAIVPATAALLALLEEAGPDARALPIDGHDFLVVAGAAERRQDPADPLGLPGVLDAWLALDKA